MRLESLEPRWRAGVLTFDCPCGKCVGRIRVPTKLATPSPSDIAVNHHRWDVSGEFPNLTLSPSVDAGCWHGFVREGEVTSA